MIGVGAVDALQRTSIPFLPSHMIPIYLLDYYSRFARYDVGGKLLPAANLAAPLTCCLRWGDILRWVAEAIISRLARKEVSVY